jgi:hypothetical protein
VKTMPRAIAFGLMFAAPFWAAVAVLTLLVRP